MSAVQCLEDTNFVARHAQWPFFSNSRTKRLNAVPKRKLSQIVFFFLLDQIRKSFEFQIDDKLNDTLWIHFTHSQSSNKQRAVEFDERTDDNDGRKIVKVSN